MKDELASAEHLGEPDLSAKTGRIPGPKGKSRVDRDERGLLNGNPHLRERIAVRFGISLRSIEPHLDPQAEGGDAADRLNMSRPARSRTRVAEALIASPQLKAKTALGGQMASPHLLWHKAQAGHRGRSVVSPDLVEILRRRSIAKSREIATEGLFSTAALISGRQCVIVMV